MTSAAITLPISEKLCKDLLTACFEGGSAYWLACDRVVYSDPEKDNYGVDKIVGCHESDVEELDAENWGDADISTMMLGIQRLLGPDGASMVNSDTIKNIAAAVMDPDSCDWDADDADCVLQLGLLGDLVYG